MMPVFFESPAALRHWLEKNHATARELIVGFYKKHTGRPSLTWPELVDQVLCFGWIDGIRRSIDADRWTIRITPRKPDSTWSRINVGRVAELTRLGLMKPEGLKAFNARTVKNTGIYTYENRPPKFAPAYQRPFKANAKAWEFFSVQPPGYQRLMTGWVMQAKKEETREKRLAQLIKACVAQKRLDLMTQKPVTKG